MSLLTKSAFEIIFPSIFSKTITPSIFVTQTRNYAARKGYREQKAKSKVKVEVTKSKFQVKKKENLPQKGSTRKFDDSWKKLASDNVYPQKYYQWPVYNFEDAIKAHRETHHPQLYNQPNAYVHVTVDLNMAGEKKNKFLENFTRVAFAPHKFEHGEERTIIAFTKLPETIPQLKEAGALHAGGVELIKQIQNGAINIQDFQYVIAHPNILPELTVLRGLMKKKFPQTRSGNLEVDLVNTTLKFYHGINYTGVKDEYEKDFGTIDTRIGTLNMEPSELEENFSYFINDVYQQRPKRAGGFIMRTVLWSPPSGEKFKIDYNLYLKSTEETNKSNDEVDVNEGEEVVEEKERVVAG
nr:39S ribosomal protein L1, mitochondrial [Onthophagus taurus]